MRTTIDIPDSMLRQVKAKCALEGRTMRGLTILFFNDWLDGGKAAEILLAGDVKAEEGGKPLAGNGRKVRRNTGAKKRGSIRNLPMIGMWKDREDMANPVEWVQGLRKPRFQ